MSYLASSKFHSMTYIKSFFISISRWNILFLFSHSFISIHSNSLFFFFQNTFSFRCFCKMSASVKCNVCSDLFKTIHPKKSCYSDIKLQQQLNKCTRFDNSKSLNSTSLQTPKTLKVAVCCSANVNRSMAAHKILSENGFSVESFGVSDKGI